MSTPAPIGVALIARNASATLGACLDSLRPWVRQIVVCVDETTTDDTAQVARDHGADIVAPVTVSDWHECPHHGRVLAQHFADARNVSFSHLDPDLDFWMWIDSDDVLVGGEHLARACAEIPADAVGFWLPYIYAQAHSSDGTATPNTVFHRERIIRTRLGDKPVSMKWQYRVHEVIVPTVAAAVRWVQNDEIRIVHQDGAHRSGASAPRNLLLLEIDLENEGDNPDPRTVFYLGNQYFAMGRWAEAAHWYEVRCAMDSPNAYEVWQSAIYASKAYQRLGAPRDAMRMAWIAIDAVPNHREPYFALAEVYSMIGDDDKVLFWTGVGRSSAFTEPPIWVFRNPLDSAFNNRVILADALVRQGKIIQARQELEGAYAAFPDARIGESIAHYRQTEREMRSAQSFVDLARLMTRDARIALYEALPEGVRRFGRARDVAIPAMIERRDEETEAA